MIPHEKMDMLAMTSRRMPLLNFFGSAASDDDFADRLNYKYTVAILVVFAFIVTNKHFSHNQINCWVPALFSKNFEEYTNLVCWITNTYYIPFDKQISSQDSDKKATELRYYQWVPYILLFLSLLFYLPRVIWRTFSLRSGIDIKDVIEASHDFKSVSKLEKNRRMIEYMIGTIDQYVDDPRRQHANRNLNLVRRTMALMCFCFGKFLGNYLVILYLFIKVLYIANCLGQLFLISVLLGRNYYIYGATIFKDMVEGKGYADSEYFPRVTMCKFQVRELGLKNFSHEYNVQCVLPINLFNQQIFTFLWFWYVVLLIINTSSLLIWVYRFVPRNQYNFAIRRIKLLRIRLIENSQVPKKFDSDYKEFRDCSRDFKIQSTVISNETNGSSHRNTAISRILSEHDYRYSFDESSIDRNKSVKNRRHENMFPNIPSSFEFNDCPKSKFKQNEDQQTLRTMRIPISNEYDSYMLPGSFCLKNYKAFVYEYLEADGMFMLRMIGSNSGDFVCTQVIHNLWKLFLFKKFVLKNDNANSMHDEKSYTTDDNQENVKSSKTNKKSRDLQNKKRTTFFNKWTPIFKDSTSAGKRVQHRVFKGKTVHGSIDLSKQDYSVKTSEDIKRIQSIKRVVHRPKTNQVI